MKKRVVSIELLRILAMMMVVMLHYLGKGQLLPALTGEMSLNGYVAWGLESLSIVAVNVYMLISGYFLVNSQFKPGRLVELLCQTLFYSILVSVVLMAAGIISVDSLTVNRILEMIFPVQMEHYWFISAYVIMYLFSPILSVAVKHMEQKQLRNTILGLLLFFGLSKSILPVELAMDNFGYDGLWFMCVFLVAAYIRLYGIPFFAKGKGRAFACYLVGCAGIYVITFVVRAFYLKTGSLDHFVQTAYDYNHVVNLFAAVSLFYVFLNMELSTEGKLAKVVYAVAPYSLGVYLLHEQLEVRYLWPTWLGATLEGNVVLLVLRCLLAVVTVYVVGTLVDALRSVLFRGASRVISKVWKK
ncbi:MAG: acyltransferase family protein [Lachnospiraceae bacterium]|nr:acyltransferase family protein [Lachnospiraceae bacterium]